jgi:hypothetical protein
MGVDLESSLLGPIAVNPDLQSVLFKNNSYDSAIVKK